MKTKINGRNLTYDLLKVIGIFCIILAHTIPKQQVFLYQLRSFDVPLMVIVSGALFWKTSKNKEYKLFDYLKKRCFRLLLPTWMFLILFFIGSYFIAFFRGVSYSFTLKQIFYSFALLIGGIGYVWIIRVFLLIAIIAPFLLNLHRKLNNIALFLAIIVIIYISYEFFIPIFLQSQASAVANTPRSFFGIILNNILISQFILLLIPYGCLFALGMVIEQIKNRSILIVSLFFGVIFFLLAYHYYAQSESFVLAQAYKYPPRLYYVSYGIFSSLLLYLSAKLIFANIAIRNILLTFKFDQILIFLSDSSLWIYLWHIFVLYYWRLFFKELGIPLYIVPQFLIVTLISLLIVIFQKRIIYWLIEKVNGAQRLKTFLTFAFLR